MTHRPAASVDLNADVGENPTPEGEALDEELFAGISAANIACGFHAGDEHSIRRSLRRATRHGVAAGAHPSYLDREGFGRRHRGLSPEQVRDQVTEQLRLFRRIAEQEHVRVSHVKPHGALYNAAAADPAEARAVAVAVARVLPGVRLVGLPGSALLRAAQEAGIPFAAEGFPERGYRHDGTLQPRGLPGDLVEDPREVGRRAVALALGEPVTTVDGAGLRLPVETLCLHSDHPSAAPNLRAVLAALTSAGVTVAARA